MRFDAERLGSMKLSNILTLRGHFRSYHVCDGERQEPQLEHAMRSSQHVHKYCSDLSTELHVKHVARFSGERKRIGGRLPVELGGNSQ